MGGSESTSQTKKSSAEFDKSWRETPWDNKELLEKNLRELKLSDSKVKYIRILLAGEVGAGKSSFINSVNSAFQRRITTEALADSVSGTSFTRTYRTYYIRNGQSLLPFVFNDIMGLESGESNGAHQEDIAKALEGLLKEGHNFNPTDSGKNDDCKSETSLEDLTYCLVYVIAADKVSMMDDDVFRKMRYIRQKASSLEIPQAVIMTRVDEACPLVGKNLQKIYTSKKIKEKMQECSNSVGVPMSHIFPVKNYHEEIDTQNDMDVLILRALTQIVQIADDLLNRRKSDSEKC
uniref:Interferon-induced 44-like protein n=1 Tax=Cyprinus carpio carpio TaxID=630221 RepID=A0A9J8BBA5_CYPCA